MLLLIGINLKKQSDIKSSPRILEKRTSLKSKESRKHLIYVQAGTRLDRLQRRLESFEEQLDIIESELEEGKINPNLIREAKAFKLTLLEEISKLKKEIEKVEEEGLHGGHRSMSKDCFLNDKNRFDFLGIQSDGRKYWRSKDQKYLYSWDGKS